MKTLVIANQKGGVGKTVLASHLIYAGCERGLRVLAVDFDQQGSLSLIFAPGLKGMTSADLFDLKTKQKPTVINKHLSLIRSDPGLLSVARADDAVIKRPRAVLKSLAGEFDLCVIDTPPSIGLALTAALAAADHVVTPLSIGPLELDGFGKLMETLRNVKAHYNPTLMHLGILPNKVNPRSAVQMEGIDALQEAFGEALMEGLPSRTAVDFAVATGEPVWKSIRGGSHAAVAKEWRAACGLILDRVKG